MPSYSREVKIPGKTPQELYDKVSQDIDRMLEKANIGKFDISRDPVKKEITLRHPMITANLVCLESAMRLDAKLSLVATPFRSKIDQMIDRWLAKTFNLNLTS